MSDSRPVNLPRIGPAWWNSHWTVLLALVLGLFAGILYNEAAREIGIGLPGRDALLGACDMVAQIFLRLLKMLVAPLVLFSIMSGVTSIGDPRDLGRIGVKTFAYYMVTSMLAIFTGLALVNLLQPGIGAQLQLSDDVRELPGEAGSLLDILIRMVPSNIFDALARMDMLQIIFFALVAGVVITLIAGEHKERLRGIIESGFVLMTAMASMVLSLLPIAVVALLFRVVARTDLTDLRSLFWYMVMIVLGLLFHFFITLPVLYFLITKRNPIKWAAAISPALMTAFSTSSSSATLPATIKAVEQRGGVSNRVSSFVLPLGSTVNMDGTALYECAGAIFLAQFYSTSMGFELTFGMQMIVVITALLASVGAAGIPSAGLVMMTIILEALQLPAEGALLLLAVDRPLDMMRTATNVWSDSVGAAIVATLEGEPPDPQIGNTAMPDS